jgi:hypothetical protein
LAWWYYLKGCEIKKTKQAQRIKATNGFQNKIVILKESFWDLATCVRLSLQKDYHENRPEYNALALQR